MVRGERDRKGLEEEAEHKCLKNGLMLVIFNGGGGGVAWVREERKEGRDG